MNRNSIVVFGLSSGTIDASSLAISNVIFEVLVTCCDSLEEKDFDHAWLDFIVSEFAINTKFDVSLLHWKANLCMSGLVTADNIADNLFIGVTDAMIINDSSLVWL